MLGLGLAMIFMILCTVPFIGRNGLVLDEVFSADITRTGTGLWQTLTTLENNMALYYATLWAWQVLGEDEFTLRLLSVIFALLTIPVLHVLVRGLFDVRTALTADFLLVANRLFLEYAGEARTYSMLLFLCTLATLLFVQGIQRPRWWIWGWYAVVLAAATYAHYFGFLMVFAHAAALAWRGRDGVPWRSFLMSIGLVVLLLVPLFLTRPRNLSQVDWIEPTSPAELFYLAVYMCGGKAPLLVVAGCLMVFTAMWWRRAFADRSWALWLVFTWLVVPILIAFAASMLIKPVFMTKYLIGCLPALLVLVAVMLNRTRPVVAISVVTLLTVLMVVGQVRHGAYGGGTWREAVAYLADEMAPDEAVVAYPYYGEKPVTYYWRRVRGEQSGPQIMSISQGPFHPGGGASDPDPDLVRISTLAKQHQRIWVVFTDDTSRRLNRHWWPQIEEVLRLQLPYQHQQKFSALHGIQSVTVYTFSRTPPSGF